MPNIYAGAPVPEIPPEAVQADAPLLHDEQDGPPWRLELTPEEVAARRMECARDGHDFEHIVFPTTGDLSGVFCTHCGERWHVVRSAAPARRRRSR